MKILLVGEFSGFYTTLKSGLDALGYDVTFASTGNTWRKFPKDISLLPNICTSKKMEDFFRYFLPSFNLKKMYGYDVVQFINPAILSPINPFNAFMGRNIVKNANRSYLSAAGDDAFYLESIQQLRYNPLDDARNIDYKGRKLSIEYSWYRNWNIELVTLVNGVIPVMYDYAQAYRSKSVEPLRNTIPLPIDLTKISYVGCGGEGQKIRVVHGLNRSGYKGTNYVEEAFAILNRRYKECAEFIIQDKMPFDKYVTSLSGFDIIVDQVNSYSSGMNGLIGMALGKVVVGGAEPESLEEFGLSHSPVINITPNVEDIVNKLSTLIDQRKTLSEIGYESRKFAEANHDHIEIAKKYIKEWSI